MTEHTQKSCFFDPNICVLVPSGEETKQSEVNLDAFDTTVHTDGSAHEFRVGTGLFIQTMNDSVRIADSEKEISIDHSPDTAIFQAELSGISVSAMLLISQLIKILSLSRIHVVFLLFKHCSTLWL